MPLAPTCDVVCVVGEPSGDAYAGAIVAALKEAHPEMVCAAMGGKHLRAAGAEIELGIEGLAVMGLGPVLKRLPEFIRLGVHLAEVIRSRRPKVVLTVDYPGFNLRLLRRLAPLRAQGTRFIHVVAPQVWAWKPRRSKSVAATVDRLLCFFPFEPPLFNRFADRLPCRATFVGHPLVDLVQGPWDTSGLDAELGFAPEDPVLLLAPGSRAREVATLLPIYHRAAEMILPRLTALSGRPVKVVVSKVPDLPLEAYRAHTHHPLVEGRWRQVLARSHAALVASGTATLEAALVGTPHIIAYRMDRFTAAIARRVLLTRHVGLPNLVANARIVPEVLQDQLIPERLAAHLLRLWEGPARTTCLAELSATRARLGAGGAVQRMAEIVAEELDVGHRGRTGDFAPGRTGRTSTEFEGAV